MHYDIKALREDNDILALSLEAADEADARRQAQAQGYAVIAVRQRQPWRQWLETRGARFPLTLFSQELLALLDAGLSLVEAFEALAENEQRPQTRKLLQQVIASLYDGHPLSHALQQFPGQFPVLYVATVRASERTGDLSSALSRFVAYQTQMDAVRKKVINASVYPLLLLGAGGLVTLFLIGYVVPRFSQVYEQMGKQLPPLSQLLINFGQLLRDHSILIAATCLLGVAALVYTARQPRARLWLVQKLWQIPAIGARMKVYQLARFFRTIGMLLRGGTPIVPALQMASDLLQSSLRAQLAQASTSIREGSSISKAMELHGLTTPVASRMLVVGERSGQMGEMMERIASFYDDEMARWIEWFSRLFEPILMAVIGVVIGTIVVLMYFPIFELAGSIQ